VTENPAPEICAYCGKRSSTPFALPRATFLGAPKGGVPVHRNCAAAWFKMMDETGWHSTKGGQR
jgi:hypothetical protein